MGSVKKWKKKEQKKNELSALDRIILLVINNICLSL